MRLVWNHRLGTQSSLVHCQNYIGLSFILPVVYEINACAFFNVAQSFLHRMAVEWEVQVVRHCIVSHS